MKESTYTVILFCLALATLISCGPSPEAIATMTAAAWTPTPEPTMTPTPMPFDLEVSLEGEDGESVTFGAYVAATEHEEVMLEESGKVELLNLPGPEVEVSIKAQGYEPHTETVTLERGVNSITFTLTADPLQVDPVTACQEGQKILYIEDFEDGFAQDWDDVSRPKFSFDDLEAGGKVLTFVADNPDAAGTVIGKGMEFSNFVWKFDTANANDLYIFIHQKDDNRYLVRFQPGGEGFQIMKQEGQENLAASAYRSFNVKEWVNVAFAFYENALEIWVDGELYVALDDADPYPSGEMIMNFQPNQRAVSLDNMIICELSQTYAPPVVEEAEE